MDSSRKTEVKARLKMRLMEVPADPYWHKQTLIAMQMETAPIHEPNADSYIIDKRTGKYAHRWRDTLSGTIPPEYLSHEDVARDYIVKDQWSNSVIQFIEATETILGELTDKGLLG